jgi:hypothetical protein
LHGVVGQWLAYAGGEAHESVFVWKITVLKRHVFALITGVLKWGNLVIVVELILCLIQKKFLVNIVSLYIANFCVH